MALEIASKANLIGQVYKIAKDILENSMIREPSKVASMTSFALSYLKQHSVSDLLILLQSNHASTASDPHWQALAKVLKPILTELEHSFPEDTQRREAALYLLGWFQRAYRSLLR